MKAVERSSHFPNMSPERKELQRRALSVCAGHWVAPIKGDKEGPDAVIECQRKISQLAQNNALLRTNKALAVHLKEDREMADPLIKKINIEARKCFHHFNLGQVREFVSLAPSKQLLDDLLYIGVKENMSLEIIQCLVKHGANPHCKVVENGRNLLMVAGIHACQETVDYLISRGINPRARDSGGETANQLQLVHRQESLAPLRLNTFFPFDNRDKYVLGGVVATVLGSALMQEYAMGLAFGLDPRFVSAQNWLRPIVSYIYAIFIPLLNTIGCEMLETFPDRIVQIVVALAEGVGSLMITSSALGFGLDLYTSIVYLMLYFCSFLIGALFQRTPPACIHTALVNYVAPLAKVATIVSLVATIALGNVLFGTLSLSHYSISLLDRYGYLPVSVQTIYYSAINAIFVKPVELVMRCVQR